MQKSLESIIPKERIKSRLIDLAAYASDAGFYYLRPKAVVQPVSEEEIIALFKFSHLHKIPITFRAAGTSLSGQSVSDGILVDLSKYWKTLQVEGEGAFIRVQPGVIGSMANARLKKYRKKIGPDPASINAAMMGGILSNNASGMCCGVKNNSYHTTKYIRFILPNGNQYSTEQPADYDRFKLECPEIFNRILELRNLLLQPGLYERIRHKYKTKNTVGYSVNAFIDYEHPLDILAHLLIGAEGTLGFIAEAVMTTVPDYPFKSTALLYFQDIYDACKAIVPLTNAGAEAIELMDRASLRSVEHLPELPDVIETLPPKAAALLVEFQANTKNELHDKTEQFFSNAHTIKLLHPPVFTENPVEQAMLWKVRKGLFPAVGAIRQKGTTVILEDIAIPVEKLGDAILDLQQLFQKHQYENGIIFGHAREGNIHFVITQSFNSLSLVERYNIFLQDVVELVVKKYDGALKAEHGTGRNMAPFVETEWGGEIYEVMKLLKQCIDPQNLLNPGVIINDDKQAHIHHLKALPQVEEEVDKCMECGFCEHRCPSRELTLTPRQRIVVRRELVTLKETGNTKQYRELLKQYRYDGMDTCAIDGLCSAACPVEINTGSLVKRLRRENHSKRANAMALLAAKNFRRLSNVIRTALAAGMLMNRVFGKNVMYNLTKGFRRVAPKAPLWSNQLSLAPDISKFANEKKYEQSNTAVVYFPACISQVMGGSAITGAKSIVETFMSVSAKAGIDCIIPGDMGGTCCGQPFSSKGFSRAYTFMANQTIEKLWQWTLGGMLPVVMDITACTRTLQTSRGVLTAENQQRFDLLTIIDSIDFIADYILPNAAIQKKKSSIALHPVCSLQHTPLEAKLIKIANSLSDNVKIPVHTGCCGMAGDRGFLFPELTRSATAAEAAEVKESEFEGYYSTSKTCEMAMSEAVGKNYQSILYLIDECI